MYGLVSYSFTFFILAAVAVLLIVGSILFFVIRAIVRAVEKKKWLKEHPDAEFYFPDYDK